MTPPAFSTAAVMVNVAGFIARIAFAVYSLLTFDIEQCGGEWTKSDFPGEYFPVISEH